MPVGLSPDAKPIADFRPSANWKADARRGSAQLRRAILKLAPRPRPLTKSRKGVNNGAFKRYGTFGERQLAVAQIERLQRAVADHYGIATRDLTGGRGPREIAEKRQVAMALARDIIQASYPDIGKCFGGRDHSTVIHACRAVETRPELALEASLLFRKLVG